MIKRTLNLLHNIVFIRYALAGSSVALLEYFLAITFEFYGVFFLYATIISAVIALIIQFISQKYYAFRHHSKDRLKTEMFLFLILWTSSLFIKSLIVDSLSRFFSWEYFINQFVAIVTAAIFSFLVYKHYIFIDKKKEV